MKLKQIIEQSYQYGEGEPLYNFESFINAFTDQYQVEDRDKFIKATNAYYQKIAKHAWPKKAYDATWKFAQKIWGK